VREESLRDREFSRPVQIRFEKRLGSVTTVYGTVALSFVIPSVPGFPASPLSPATTYVVLSKENHMQLTEAATLDRKSGEAEGSAVSRTSAGNAEYYTQTKLSLDRSVPGFPATQHWTGPRVRLSLRKGA